MPVSGNRGTRFNPAQGDTQGPIWHRFDSSSGHVKVKCRDNATNQKFARCPQKSTDVFVRAVYFPSNCLRRSTCASLNGSLVCAYLQSFSGERPINLIRPSHLASKSRRATLPPSRFTTSSLRSCVRSCPSICAQVLTTFR